jgi:RimJ/RimL family protein N-acetyltransferase
LLPNGLPPLPEIDALALSTDRLDLIPITRAHAPAMFQILKDPALYEYVTGSPPVDVAALTRQYEFWECRRSPDGSELWLNWALRLQGKEELIGHLQAGVLPDHANVAWILGAQWQHLGFATEAAKAVVDLLVRIGVREIRASINPAHAISIAVAERLGLQQTAEIADGELIWKRVYSTATDSGRETR